MVSYKDTQFWALDHSDFEFVSGFVLRISDFRSGIPEDCMADCLIPVIARKEQESIKLKYIPAQIFVLQNILQFF